MVLSQCSVTGGGSNAKCSRVCTTPSSKLSPHVFDVFRWLHALHRFYYLARTHCQGLGDLRSARVGTPYQPFTEIPARSCAPGGRSRYKTRSSDLIITNRSHWLAGLSGYQWLPLPDLSARTYIWDRGTRSLPLFRIARFRNHAHLFFFFSDHAKACVTVSSEALEWG